MKKRSMLAIASLATGFVVAAVTPSHSQGADALGNLDLQDTVTTVDRTVSQGSMALDDGSPEED
ncbi:hypothetical protein [Streptomyces beigongshangae]|uniref:hypothetical protein n=1 Tax=Streptomyces beigongshangae TaxID=2841597 RepID=UPI001C85C6C9|nr:hypothetical protein [Streptomyces sp. REN17]